MEELQAFVGSRRAGYQDHHIVEQTWARNDGYPEHLINGRDNVVNIPTLKHREITSWYQTKNDYYGGLSPRDYLKGADWETRYHVGLFILRKYKVLKP